MARTSTAQSKFTRAKTVAQDIPVQETFGLSQEQLEAAMRSDPKRLIAANVLWLVSFGATYYWTASAVSTLAAAAVLLTGSAFIGFMIAFIGGCLAIWAAWRTARKVFGLVIEFDMGTAQQVVDAKASKVRAWFSASSIRSDR